MALAHTPIELEQLSPAVAKAIGPAAQGPARMMAARGMLPLGPQDLVTALYQLALDRDLAVAQAARATADGLPENILGAALGAALDPRVLDFFSRQALGRTQLLETLLLNRAIHDETLIELGKRLDERSAEILAGNQERLLRCPAIIESIYFNKHARMSTVKRLLELAVRQGIELDALPAFKEIKEHILGRVRGELPVETPEQEAAMDDVLAVALTGEEEGPVGDLEYQEGETKEKSANPLEWSLLDKLRAASVGSAVLRAQLIKDSNKTVIMTVIKSPAVSDQEAARFAANRSLHEDVIRYIASRPDWLKNPQVKLNLVNNPKCPLAQSLRLLNYLRAPEVRALARSKNVPAALAKAAKAKVRSRG